MNNQKLQKLIDIIHTLKEEGVGITGVPTNNASSEQISGLPPDQPPVFSRANYAKGGKGSRRWWLQYLKLKKKTKSKKEGKE
jgi:hypothetical protein